MRKTHLPRLVTILIITVITVVFWIVVDVYRALTIKPAPQVSEKILAPLNPDLDEAVLSAIEKRVYIPDSEITSVPIRTVTTESAPATQVSVPSPSPTASLEPSPTPTP